MILPLPLRTPAPCPLAATSTHKTMPLRLLRRRLTTNNLRTSRTVRQTKLPLLCLRVRHHLHRPMPEDTTLVTVCPVKVAGRLHLNPSISRMCHPARRQMAQVHPQIFTAREDISRSNSGLSLGWVEMIQSQPLNQPVLDTS